MNFRTLLATLALIMSVSIDGWTQTAASDSPLEIIPADEIFNALNAAPLREGLPPETPDGIPHQQLNQNAPLALQEELMASVSVLPGVQIEPTPFSLEGSQGWRLDGSFAQGPEDAFIRQSPEFGHLHRPSDGSMHMLLPLAFSIVALEKGWGIIHPLTDSISGEHSDYVMIYGPRDEDELKTIWIIAQISYYYARGLSMDPKSSTAITPATWGWVKDKLRLVQPGGNNPPFFQPDAKRAYPPGRYTKPLGAVSWNPFRVSEPRRGEFRKGWKDTAPSGADIQTRVHHTPTHENAERLSPSLPSG